MRERAYPLKTSWNDSFSLCFRLHFSYWLCKRYLSFHFPFLWKIELRVRFIYIFLTFFLVGQINENGSFLYNIFFPFKYPKVIHFALKLLKIKRLNIVLLLVEIFKTHLKHKLNESFHEVFNGYALSLIFFLKLYLQWALNFLKYYEHTYFHNLFKWFIVSSNEARNSFPGAKLNI